MMAARFPVDFRALGIGDCVPTDGGDRPALYTPGPARWHALTVRPQREDQVEAWLALRGVYAFHPVLMRRTKVKGRVREYARRYLPGYVFARFNGEPLVHRVLDCDHVVGALTLSSGEWGILNPAKLAAIHAMRKVDAEGEARRAAEAARRRQAAQLRNGDRALFRAGPFAGMACEVVSLKGDGGVVVRIDIFGRPTLGEAMPVDLVPLRKQG